MADSSDDPDIRPSEPPSKPNDYKVGYGNSFMLMPIGGRLGRPLGFPDVPLTNRVAMPASCSLSYLPAGGFDSEGRSIWDLSNESVMGAPKVGFKWSFEISTFPPSISHLNTRQ